MSTLIDPEKSYLAVFNRFSFEMSGESVLDCSHSGDCDEDCKAWEKKIDLSEIPADDIREELDECGAWDDDELADDERNRVRIIWIGAGNIKENEHEDQRKI